MPVDAQPGVLDQPHPVLQNAGFTGPVSEFNKRVEDATHAYQAAHGLTASPPPGLILDVARQQQVPTPQIPSLFKPEYGDPQKARIAGSIIAAHQANPDGYMVQRVDGVVQPENPVRRVIAPPSQEPGYQQLQKKYPMVMEGGLPIPHLQDFYSALGYLNKPVPQGSKPGSPLATVAPLSQFTGPTTPDVQAARRAVTTVKQAQHDLNREMGTSLPETGILNQDWVTTLQNWTKSRQYFQKQLAYQANQDGFGNNTAAYMKAWKSKQQATRHGLYGWFLSTMPLPLFGHGGFLKSVESIPGYLAGNSANPINIGLHGLTRTAGLALDTIGGTVDQLKADAAAGTTFAAYMLQHQHDSNPKHTFEQALAASKKQLLANPTWLRAFGFGHVPVNEPHWLNLIDSTTNVAGDLILLRKPGFTGETVQAGDLAAAAKSEHLVAASRWAYSDLAAHGIDGIGRAASRLGGEPGARALVARAARGVQRVVITPEQFTQHVAELYATGHTAVEVGDRTAAVSGPVLSALRTSKLPTPGAPGTAWLKAKDGLRQSLDEFDRNAKHAPGVTKAVDFANYVRTQVAHAAPEGGRLGYFQDILPERVFNFVRKYELGDDTLANKLESQLVRHQGTGNVRGIQGIERKLRGLWEQKYPSKTPPSDEPFHALISSETPSIFHFPGGTERAAGDAWDNADTFGRKVNAALNKAAKIHARVILSGLNPLTGFGGLSLFWKHTVGDGLRAIQAGVATGFNPSTRAALKDLDRMAREDPAIARRYGALLDELRTGETSWALNRGGGRVFSEDFASGDHLNKLSYLRAAAGYLRRHAEAAELDGYRTGRLTDVILRNREARAAWKSMRSRLGPDYTAEEHATAVEAEYRNIENALVAKGRTWDDITRVIEQNRGHEADNALAKFIKSNELDFNVRGGLVDKTNPLDTLAQRWIGDVVMRPNKMWRAQLGKAVIGKYFDALRKQGIDDKTAFDIASTVAERTVKYHMLDFANRLQVEQDLRWISYFATKHRLYFKWVLGTFLRHPGYAAAVHDFAKVLNAQGGITIPIKVFGTEWQIPAERLVWVPGHEYDETSPLGKAVIDFIKSGGSLDAVVKDAIGTQGNVVTRSDTATILGTKLLRVETGLSHATYGYAYAGLNKTTADKIKRAINEYQWDHYLRYGHYAPQSQAVKLVLLHQLGQEYWRANLPLPLVPYQPQTEQDKLLAQYEALIDPKARREFLDKHPGFSDNFGVYQDPKKYLHNQPFFERWAKTVDAYKAGRAHLLAEARKTGEWTPELEADRRALSAGLERTRNQLLIEDARQSGIDTHGLVPNGTTVPYGIWGKVVNKDPQFDPTHYLNTLFPHLAKAQQTDVIGPLQQEMRNELQQLNDPKYVASSNYTPNEVKTRKRELLQSLDVFNSYPTDALGALQHSYQTKYVNKYWAEYDQRYTAIGKLPSGERGAADAAFRAWRDGQDQPVKINGVTFPAPLRMAWALLDPVTREQRLSYLASKPLTDLANYELDLLDVKHPPNVSEAFAAIEQAKNEYHQKYPGHGLTKQQLIQVAKQVDKQPGYRGFYSYYVNVALQPRIRQFEMTGVYRNMPAPLKGEFDQYIGSAAIKVAHAAEAGHSSYYDQQWRTAIKTQVQPWLDSPDQKPLRDYLARFGPNFLDTLVSK